ncbi:YwmB family TATA-box binding protein [Oceanobacillus jeddahense]|uniref:YwmB family TATA-box binding protein n=1 Tax=Oceanobacillus jeddahense TaxID=1462527 RepID=A0ABY5JU42_9BACI|nr:YwmB family TATA-box binding protein [Oceanobacillus jeddahense]UUI02606.1 YwmB family TATA-box binding protein [Oceanobacillus jeddahense]
MFHRILFSSKYPIIQATKTLHMINTPVQRRNQAFCLLLVICFVVNQAFSQSYQTDEMQDLGAFAEENDFAIDFWEVTIKEQMGRERAESLVENLETMYTQHEDKNGDRVKYTFYNGHNNEPFYVLYNVILPLDKKEPAEVIIVLHGKDWDSQISQKYEKEKAAIQKKYLTKESQLYTCLSIQDSDIINHDEFLNKAKKYFNIKHISTNYDNIENSRIEQSTYGYIKTWEHFYFMENDPKNVHIAAVTGHHGEKSFMIGTPILINEY